MKLFTSLLGLLFCIQFNLFAQVQPTADQLIAKIIQETGSKTYPKTVDVIKMGDPDTKITGVVSCMFATMEVLQKAVDLKCNLIITHEPVFYNHFDNTEKFNDDPVFLAKKAFIEKHQLVIWRFHDYVHSIRPDGILTGMVNKLNWKGQQVDPMSNEFEFEEFTLKNLLKDLKSTFPESTFQVIGDSDMEVRRAALAMGAPGSDYHFQLLRRKDIDVVIAGEVPQWETYEYVRDAQIQGKPKAIVFLGHINSEESGMKFAADWMGEFIELPVHFVPCGPSFWNY